MEKTINIGGIDVRFVANAATPKKYRHKFGRDLMLDIDALTASAVNIQKKEQKFYTVDDLENFENAAWTMAKQADDSIPDEPDEWLEVFEMFDIYRVLPELLMLWNLNMRTTAKPKKK